MERISTVDGQPPRQLSRLAVAIVVLVPLIQVLAQPSWIFTPDGGDPWFYHGYFIDLKHHVVAFAGSYYGSRLAWILPGYVAHSLLSPLVANAILRLFVYWTAILSAYSFIRRTHGIHCAVLVSLLLCSYPGLLCAVGWDYVDGAGIAYSLLCLEELDAAVRASPRWLIGRAAIGGMAFAAAVHSNMFLIVLIPVISLLFLVRAGIKCIPIAASAVAGFAALTSGLGLISVRLGGPFLFFLPSVQEIQTLGSSPNPWYENPSTWLGHAWWLVVPAAICVVIIAFLASLISARRSAGWSREALIRATDAASLALLFAIFVAISSRGLPVLQFNYYADYLTIFLPAAAGALIGSRLESLRTSAFSVLVGLCSLLAVLVGTEIPRLFSSPVAAAYIALRAKPAITAMSLTAILAAGILWSLYLKRRVLSGAVAGACVGITLIHLGSLQLRESTGSTISRESYLYTDRTSRELTQLSRDGQLWFWYSYSKGNEYYTSVAATYIWAARLLNWTLPSTVKLRLDVLQRGTYVAIMNDSETVQQEAIQALARNGVKVKKIKRLTSTVGAARLLINVVQVTRRELAPRVYTSSPSMTTLRAGSQIMDYDTAALLAHTSRVLYGEKPTMAAILPPWVVRSADSRDHIATGFEPLALSDEIAAVRVSIIERRVEDTYGSVNLILQKQDYGVLYESGTVQGQSSVIVGLAPGTRAIRVALLPNDGGFIRIPERVTLEGLKRK